MSALGRNICLITAGIFSSSVLSHAQTFQSREFQVKTHTEDSQDRPSAVMGRSGNFVTAWNGFGSVGSSTDSKSFLEQKSAAGVTAVELIAFTATADAAGVRLQWQTGFEVDNLGFNLYREVAGERTLLNLQLVAGSALLVGLRRVLGAGESYSWLDAEMPGRERVEYWLEDVDLDGSSTWHGPIEVPQLADRSLQSDNAPQPAPAREQARLLSQVGLVKEQQHLTLPVEPVAALAPASSKRLEQQSYLAGQPGVKLGIKRAGWYRVTQPELVEAGFAPETDPRHLQLFVDAHQLPIVVTGSEDGRFDPVDAVEFYGLTIDVASTDLRTYWLVSGAQPGLRIRMAEALVGSGAPTNFPYSVERKDRTLYFSSLRNGESENFFGPVVSTKKPVEQTLLVQHLVASGGEATLEITLQGATVGKHRVEVALNDETLGEFGFNGHDQGFARFPVSPVFLREGENRVRLTAQSTQRDISLIDTIRLTYPHSYTAEKDSLRFTALGEQRVSIDGFSQSGVQVLDVTDPDFVQSVKGIVTREQTAYTVRVDVPGTGQRTLVAFTEAHNMRPAAIAPNQPSNWREAAAGADLVMICHPDFAHSLAPLKALRESQGLNVKVVDVEDIFDEFSFGHKLPKALRDFLGFAVEHWASSPRFVLLVGDASLDPKNYQGHGNFDFVPTKLLDTMLMETASDDWFADFDADGLAELAVGRLPVRTATEADTMVAKIVTYEQGSEAGGGVLFVAGGNDGPFDFEATNKQLRSLLPEGTEVASIDRGKLDKAAARRKLLENLNRGPQIVNFSGHGSVNLWGGSLLSTADVDGLTNGENLSIFVMMTCLNAYFQDAALDSLAETLMKAEQAGPWPSGRLQA